MTARDPLSRAQERHRKLLYLDGPFCWLCARYQDQPDNMRVCLVVPKALGGGEGIANLRLACPSCAAARKPPTDADLDLMLRDVSPTVIGRMFHRDTSFAAHGRCWRLKTRTTAAQGQHDDARPVFSEPARLVAGTFITQLTHTSNKCDAPFCGDWASTRVIVSGLRGLFYTTFVFGLCPAHGKQGLSGRLVRAEICLDVLRAKASGWADRFPHLALPLYAFIEEISSLLGLPDPASCTAAVVPSETCEQPP